MHSLTRKRIPRTKNIAGFAAVAVLAAMVFSFAAPGAEKAYLRGPLAMPAMIAGKVSGTVTLNPGTEVDVLRREGGQALVSCRAGELWVDAGTISSEPLSADEIVKAKLAPALAAAPVPTPTPTPEPSPGQPPEPPLPPVPSGKEDVPSGDPESEAAVFGLVNRERAAAGLAALEWDEDLARAARFHAAHMAENAYFDHDTISKPRGKILGCFGRLAKFSPSACAENIAAGQPDARTVMACWMKSPGHRQNILRRNIKTLGVGYVAGRWVQDFGR